MSIRSLRPLVIVAALCASATVSRAQGLEDVGFIFHEAYIKREAWLYDKGFVRKPNAVVAKERRDIGAYYYAIGYVGGPYQFRDTETIAEADPDKCVVTITNHVDRSSPDAIRAEGLKGQKNFIPDQIIDQALQSSQTTVFYLNNVIVEDLSKSVDFNYGTQYIFRLRGDREIACQSGRSFQQTGPSDDKWIDVPPKCEKELSLVVSRDNLRRFETVLETAFKKLCRGAKREGKF